MIPVRTRAGCGCRSRSTPRREHGGGRRPRAPLLFPPRGGTPSSHLARRGRITVPRRRRCAVITVRDTASASRPSVSSRSSTSSRRATARRRDATTASGWASRSSDGACGSRRQGHGAQRAWPRERVPRRPAGRARGRRAAEAAPLSSTDGPERGVRAPGPVRRARQSPPRFLAFSGERGLTRWRPGHLSRGESCPCGGGP